MPPDKGPEQHARDSPGDRHSTAATTTSEQPTHSTDRNVARQVSLSHGHNKDYGDHPAARHWGPSDIDHDRRSRHDEGSWKHHRLQRDYAYDAHSSRPQRAYDGQRSRQHYTNSSRRDTGYSRRYSPVNRGYSPEPRRPLGDADRFDDRGDSATHRHTDHWYDKDRYALRLARQRSQRPPRHDGDSEPLRKRSRSQSISERQHFYKRCYDSPSEDRSKYVHDGYAEHRRMPAAHGGPPSRQPASDRDGRHAYDAGRGGGVRDGRGDARRSLLAMSTGSKVREPPKPTREALAAAAASERKSSVGSVSPKPPRCHIERNVSSTVASACGGISTPATPATPKQRSPSDGIQMYTRISMVGEGTYGKVYKARNKETGRIVALKRMRVDMDREGFPITAMREIRLLKQLRHPNITRVLDVVPEVGNAICVVMEYMDYDLSGLISHPQWEPEPAHKKSLMHQLLEGLDFMHTRGILHRDIKGSNLLVNQQGQVKYVDFGLARSFHHTRMQELTNRVITLWYRPPELLLGTTLYGPEVDIWSLGCVLLELFTKKPAFQGQNDIDQLEQIFKLLGTPSPAIWESLKKLPWACYMTPTARYENRMRVMLSSKMSACAVDLISWMLSLDPAARPSAGQCLGHSFFAEAPAPSPPTSFPVSGDWHEYESKAEKRKRKQATASAKQRN
ncbi:kinase subunit of RNA polymerase II carboxy-terminal domain kinase I [Coemansia sp. BCRC 34301]|nr:kinase subunit of RNA polymerase II carboxy-terminal domain kinase I [Coemansia sp. BCRC 34301]